MTGGRPALLDRSSAARAGLVVLAALVLEVGTRAADRPPPVVIEAGPPIMRISIRLQSMSQMASDGEFERALADTPAQRDAAERMRASLAGELNLYQARRLHGQERVDLLETAARGGDAAAAAAVGEMFDVGDGVLEDAARATAYYRAGAIGGRMDAAHNLGAALAKGRGVPLDFVEALAWLTVARQRGDPSGADQQLRQHLQSRGKVEAIAAAEQRADSLAPRVTTAEISAALPAAQPLVFDAARSIAVGDDTNQVEAEPGEEPASPPVTVTTILGVPHTWPSLEALRRAANHGDATAMGALGRLLTNGKRLPPDALAAVVWLERSAALGDIDAAHQLGDLYSKGDGIVPDDRKAFAYYLQGARGGSALSMASVGVFHTNGRGTARDLVQGLAWLIAARHFGVDLGQEARLRGFLTQHQPAELAKAEQLSKTLLQEFGRPSRP